MKFKDYPVYLAKASYKIFHRNNPDIFEMFVNCIKCGGSLFFSERTRHILYIHLICTKCHCKEVMITTPRHYKRRDFINMIKIPTIFLKLTVRYYPRVPEIKLDYKVD